MKVQFLSCFVSWEMVFETRRVELEISKVPIPLTGCPSDQRRRFTLFGDQRSTKIFQLASWHGHWHLGGHGGPKYM